MKVPVNNIGYIATRAYDGDSSMILETPGRAYVQEVDFNSSQLQRINGRFFLNVGESEKDVVSLTTEQLLGFVKGENTGVKGADKNGKLTKYALKLRSKLEPAVVQELNRRGMGYPVPV